MQRSNRPSNALNEDDYDYVLELRPDDEYRLAAEGLSEITDDIDSGLDRCLEAQLEERTRSIEKRESSLMSYFSAEEMPSGRNSLEYSDRLNYSPADRELEIERLQEEHQKLLDQQEALLEYERKKQVEKLSFDRFLVALSTGIHVTLHQANQHSETVRLYSSNSCMTVKWSPVVARDLASQKKYMSTRQLELAANHARYTSVHDQNSLDSCLFSVCGCGDDVAAGNHESIGVENDSEIDGISQPNSSEHSRNRFCCYNYGFKKKGCFSSCDIIAVHKAALEDPTKSGFFGTESLRMSKNVYNPSYTFSVVLKVLQPVPAAGCTGNFANWITGLKAPVCVDIECESEALYDVLYDGFRLLSLRCQSADPSMASSADNPISHMLGSGFREIELWRHSPSSALKQYFLEKSEVSVFSPTKLSNLEQRRGRAGRLSIIEQELQHAEKKKNPIKMYSVQNHAGHPIKSLFKAPFSIDPLRALGVGGGFLPVQRSQEKSMHMMCPTSSLPTTAFLGWHSAGTRIWSRLRLAGLEVKCVYSWDLRRVILKIRCPDARLEEVAEKMHLRIRKKDGSLKVFKRSRRETFQPVVLYGDQSDTTSLFRSSERQQIIDFIIRSKIVDGGAELDEGTDLGAFIVQRFPLHMYSRIEEMRHNWVTFWKLEKLGEVSKPWSFFSDNRRFSLMSESGDEDSELPVVHPMHEKVTMQLVIDRSWKSITHFFGGLLIQPLDSVSEYYGEDVAFYFAFLAFYTRWLIVPSILGSIVFILQMHQGRLDNVYCIPYAVFIMVWASFMLVFWRQKSSTLAYRWGVLEYEVEETERPQFHGEYVYDDVSGEVIKVYPAWKRLLKYVVTFPVFISTIVIMVCVMATVFSTQDQLLVEYTNHAPLQFAPSFSLHRGTIIQGNSTGVGNVFLSPQILEDPTYWTVSILYPCLYVVLVEIFAAIVGKLSVALNSFENHQTQSTYMSRLILKVFTFRFLAVNMPLLYYAITLTDPEEVYVRMSVMIFCQMTVGTMWSTFLDVGAPALYQRLMLYHMKMNVAKANREVYKAREYSDGLQEDNDVEIGEHHVRQSSAGSSESFLSGVSSMKNDYGKSLIDRRQFYLEQARSKCWEEALQPTYNVFGDYTNLVIQLGFILLYAPVFPLAPLFALICNIVIIRVNAFKLTFTRQRPVARKVNGIGIWEDVVQIISVCGVLANLILFGIVSQQLSDSMQSVGGSVAVVVFLFFFEHFILLFKYWLSTSVPKVPLSIRKTQQRERRSTMDHNHKREDRKASKAYDRHSFLCDDKDDDDASPCADRKHNRVSSYIPFAGALKSPDPVEQEHSEDANAFHAHRYSMDIVQNNPFDDHPRRTSVLGTKINGSSYHQLNKELYEYPDTEEEEDDNEDEDVQSKVPWSFQSNSPLAKDPSPMNIRSSMSPVSRSPASPVRSILRADSERSPMSPKNVMHANGTPVHVSPPRESPRRSPNPSPVKLASHMGGLDYPVVASKVVMNENVDNENVGIAATGAIRKRHVASKAGLITPAKTTVEKSTPHSKVDISGKRNRSPVPELSKVTPRDLLESAMRQGSALKTTPNYAYYNTESPNPFAHSLGQRGRTPSPTRTSFSHGANHTSEGPLKFTKSQTKYKYYHSPSTNPFQHSVIDEDELSSRLMEPAHVSSRSPARILKPQEVEPRGPRPTKLDLR